MGGYNGEFAKAPPKLKAPHMLGGALVGECVKSFRDTVLLVWLSPQDPVVSISRGR
jgi:hypothetical protein